MVYGRALPSNAMINGWKAANVSESSLGWSLWFLECLGMTYSKCWTTDLSQLILFLLEIQNPSLGLCYPPLQPIHSCYLLSMAGDRFKPVMPWCAQAKAFVGEASAKVGEGARGNLIMTLCRLLLSLPGSPCTAMLLLPNSPGHSPPTR